MSQVTPTALTKDEETIEKITTEALDFCGRTILLTEYNIELKKQIKSLQAIIDDLGGLPKNLTADDVTPSVRVAPTTTATPLDATKIPVQAGLKLRPQIDTYQCEDCGEFLPISDFPKNSTKMGHGKKCNPCIGIDQKKKQSDTKHRAWHLYSQTKTHNKSLGKGTIDTYSSKEQFHDLAMNDPLYVVLMQLCKKYPNDLNYRVTIGYIDKTKVASFDNIYFTTPLLKGVVKMTNAARKASVPYKSFAHASLATGLSELEIIKNARDSKNGWSFEPTNPKSPQSDIFNGSTH